MTPPPFELALVTGASSGIGQALARHLAQQGIPLLLTGRNTEALQSLQAELQGKVPTEFIIADLADDQQREKLLANIRSKGPDLVINNAGFGLYGDAVNLSRLEQADMVKVNVQAVTEIALEAGRALKEQEKPGIILNVSSAIGFLPGPGFTVYGATKAFVNSLSQGLDHELRPFGIRVLVACPGVVRTQFSIRAAKGRAHQASPAGLEVPLQKVVEHIWKQILKKHPVRIIDWRYRLLVALSRMLPSRLVGKALYDTIKAKRLKP